MLRTIIITLDYMAQVKVTRCCQVKVVFADNADKRNHI